MIHTAYAKNLIRKHDLEKTCFIGLGRETESGDKLLSDLRDASGGRVAVEQCKLSHYWDTIEFARFESFVFIDDFVGTGKQACEFFETIDPGFPKSIFYCYLAGMEKGIKRVKKFLSERFYSAVVDSVLNIDIKNAFLDESIFGNPEDAAIANTICKKYGNYLKQFESSPHASSYPLGFADEDGNPSCALFATEYNTPNNSLPIFWSTVRDDRGRLWPAPFPRKHKITRMARVAAQQHIMEHKMHEAHKVGRLVIDSIIKHQPFSVPLAQSDIVCEYTQPKQLPEPLQRYYSTGLEDRIAALRAKGKSVQINKGYSLNSTVIDKIQVEGVAGRKHFCKLVFEPADYSHQIMFGERINDEGIISCDNSAMSIREYMERYHDVNLAHFDWPTVSNIVIPQRFANVVGLLVRRSKSDPSVCFIGSIRSSAMMVNEDYPKGVWPATMSCAEGMLRPDDAGGHEGEPPSPFKTAIRALGGELGLFPGEHFKINDIKMLALAYDGKRCQPVACFMLEALDLDYETVEDLWNTRAEDNNESKAIFPVPLNPSAISSLLRGDFYWEGHQVKMFSNHQQIGLLALAERKFGLKSLAI